MNTLETQVAVIGAGPIGIEMAVALKQAGIDYVQFEAGQVAQTITWYPRQVRFFSSPSRIAIAGVPLHTADQSKASREEYLAYLRSVVQQFDLNIHTYERVNRIINTPMDDQTTGFGIETYAGGEHRDYVAKQVIVTIGDMHRPRMLHVPGEDLTHVSHYFDEPHQYFRQKLLIVGGKNSAVETAIRCARAGAQVTLVHRQDMFDEKSVKYWLMPEIRSMIDSGMIQFYPETVVKRIEPRKVTLEQQQKTMTVDADFVLLLTGYEMDATLFEQAGVELVGDNHAPKFDEQTMQTNVPGLYVAGTAAAGTQKKFHLFIENCHVHVARILAHLTGDVDLTQKLTGKHYILPES